MEKILIVHINARVKIPNYASAVLDDDEVSNVIKIQLENKFLRLLDNLCGDEVKLIDKPRAFSVSLIDPKIFEEYEKKNR